MTKIAVPSDDGVSIAGHFGRCAGFLVFSVAEGRIAGTELRPNSHTAFARGECSGSAGHGHEQAHGHTDLVTLLNDCATVLCYGMGWRAAESLKAGGIEPLVVGEIPSAQEAVEAYLAGSLPTSASFCRCRH